jgi:DNA-binding CsgD family transcriptional regulator
MSAPILIFIHGPLAGKRITLDKDEHTAGRSSQNEIVLEDSLASRVHAIFMRRGGMALIEDLGSHNGTYLNDERLHGVRQLHHGDRVGIGRSRILFEDPSQIYDASTEISEAGAFAATTFTQRQIQVLRLMARGLSNKQIGERLFVSERTVKAYVSSIFEKLQVSKRAAAVAAALRLGLIEHASEDDAES